MRMNENRREGGLSVTTKIQKWGNSLAVRIPQHIAEEVAVEQGTEVELIVEEQEIKMVPKKRKPTLDELLAKVTEDNRHHEMDFGVEGDEKF